MYCKNEIVMGETLGRWFPLNLDNSPHMCREKKVAKVASKKALTMEDLDLRLRMVESLVLKGAKK